MKRCGQIEDKRRDAVPQEDKIVLIQSHLTNSHSNVLHHECVPITTQDVLNLNNRIIVSLGGHISSATNMLL